MRLDSSIMFVKKKGTVSRNRLTHVQQEVVLEDPLHRLEQIGAQRQRVPERFLALAEKLGQRLAPHALCQHSHRPVEAKTRRVRYQACGRGCELPVMTRHSQ